jgi:MFS superfamily sulfate permease-like transporter
MVKTEGRMTFASAPHARKRLAALIGEAHPEVVILECSAIPDFEYTAQQALTKAEEKLRDGGIALWLAALIPRPSRRSRAHGWVRLWERSVCSSTSAIAVNAYDKRGITV